MSDSALTIARNYLDLTKPRLLPMVLFTGLPVMGMAAGGWPSLGFVVVTLFLPKGIVGTLNEWIDNRREARTGAVGKPQPAAAE